MIGTSLTKLLLGKGHKVIILTRNLKRAIDRQAPDERLTYARWNAREQSIDHDAIEKADYIVHLAGEGIADKRWTAKRKKEIVQSRIQGSSLLIKALKEIPNQVKAVVSASSIGWYKPDEPGKKASQGFVETDPSDPSFSGETCKWWEESIEPVTSLKIRLVKFRFGFVLANEGGAFLEFSKPVQFGIASILGRRLTNPRPVRSLSRPAGSASLDARTETNDRSSRAGRRERRPLRGLASLRE